MKRASTLLIDGFQAFPDDPDVWAWPIVQATAPLIAKQFAKALGEDEFGKLQRAIDLQLQPMEATIALKAWWYHSSQGEEIQGTQIIEEFQERGVPLPSFSR